MADPVAPTPPTQWWLKPAQQSPALALVAFILWGFYELLSPLSDSISKMLLTCTGSPLN